MNRRDFLSLMGVASLSAAAAAPKPNIVFILADDLGYGDLSCYGQKMFETPNIDRLAAEGTRFTQAYAGAAVCAPSRCCLMTGLHTGHSRVRANSSRAGRVSLRPDDVTVAEVLKTAGYRTAAIGKWGIGEAGTNGVPNLQGFDEWFGFLNQDHALDYYATHLWDNQREYFPSGNQGGRQKDYVQDLFTRRALDFLSANKDNPFFLYLPYTLPHPSSEMGRATGDGFVVPGYEPFTNRDWPRQERGFAAMVHMLDRDVGRVVSHLRTLGLESNTLVIFASDNGPETASGHNISFFKSAGGLRGSKSEFYEGGIRVPAIARWPGRIAANKTSDELWAFWDFFPTATELAGLSPPPGIDGISLAPALFGQERRQHDYLYWEVPGKQLRQAVRMKNWKGLRNGQAPLELYNLAIDPTESQDVAKQHPDVVAAITRIMVTARVESDIYPTLEGAPKL